MRLTLINLILILFFISGCYTQQSFENVVDTKSDETEKEVISINGEELLNSLDSLSTSTDPSFIYSLLETSYDYLEDVNSQMRYSTEKRISSEISKESFCEITKSYSLIIVKIIDKLNEKDVKKNIILSGELNSLKGYILAKYQGVKDILISSQKYCEEESILKLTKTKEAYEVNSLYFEYAGFKNVKDKVESYQKQPPTKIQQESTSYGIGDSIEKGGLKVTLRSVDKRYLSWENSYNRNDYEWSIDEWNNEITEYQYQIRIARDEATKQKLIDELNSKFGDRVREEWKWWFFDVEVLPSDDSPDSPAWELMKIYKDQDVEIMSIYDIETDKWLDTREFLYYSMTEGRGLFPRRDNSSNLKLRISFDHCGSTLIDLEAIEKGQMCDNTYIFNVDLEEV